MDARFARILVFVAVASLMVCGTAWYFVWGDSVVQPLVMKGFGDRLPVPNQVTVFASTNDLGRLAGRNAASLAEVDFQKHELVRIGWQVDGPAFGTLRFVERFGGRRILFYVDCLPTDDRTFSSFVYENWFIVSKGARVEMASSAHVAALDATFWLVEGAIVVLALWIGRHKRSTRGAATSSAPVEFEIAD